MRAYRRQIQGDGDDREIGGDDGDRRRRRDNHEDDSRDSEPAVKGGLQGGSFEVGGAVLAACKELQIGSNSSSESIKDMFIEYH